MISSSGMHAIQSRHPFRVRPVRFLLLVLSRRPSGGKSHSLFRCISKKVLFRKRLGNRPSGLNPGLGNQHRIPVAKEAVLFFHGVGVRSFH